MTLTEIADGVFEINHQLFTKDICPERKYFNDKKITYRNEIYREWNPFRSKLAAAIKKGLKDFKLRWGDTILYLGSAEGYTVSHVSDIIGKDGLVFCVDVSEIAMMKLIKLAEDRTNILPILNDAQNTQNYAKILEETCGKVDSLFQDISQRNQADIFIRNAQFLKQHRPGALVIKAKSISQSKKKEEVLAEEKKMLEKEFEVLQVVDLAPYEKHHYLILVKKK